MWEGDYDSISLNPFEQLFVKVKKECADPKVGRCRSTSSMAIAYDRMLSSPGNPDMVAANHNKDWVAGRHKHCDH